MGVARASTKNAIMLTDLVLPVGLSLQVDRRTAIDWEARIREVVKRENRLRMRVGKTVDNKV